MCLQSDLGALDSLLMWLRVLSCGWMWLILEKRSEILAKNFISNIRFFFFLASEIQKDVQKVTSFVLSYSNSALYIWLCFWTHTRTVSPPCSFDTLVINVVQFHICRFPSFFTSCSTAAVRAAFPHHCHQQNVYLVHRAPTGPDGNIWSGFWCS